MGEGYIEQNMGIEMAMAMKGNGPARSTSRMGGVRFFDEIIVIQLARVVVVVVVVVVEDIEMIIECRIGMMNCRVSKNKSLHRPVESRKSKRRKG